ncbi:hypothetical protein TVAG_156060 [Trichomonas vaginalis G3]|uniref:Rab-GAP TBC domain-containing protein n=1 Tax=Trichomonas vaginalis (strain ATCC PRA-98 / G3) TaxID=412133 RepID=A2FPC9_TRIV3|nr:TBC domain-containing protein kinase-like protein family [Trichomonas vaginalis G3]EAX93242.1 hypothetical protein TVAG_156060 [Trichomonas vaginalis G3]KAI5516858.1 TBC domain-containing protein kinase-like protein family [Trichomonas vaginalis G3]|eukprot:XP_001306172.1 hypothetical protein [Trichomonas vaginalis G3]
MVRERLSLTDVIRALSEYQGVIYDKEDAQRFLSLKNLAKDNSLRLISWLLIFDKISTEENRAKELYTIFKRYTDELSKHFQTNLTNPLESINDAKISRVIKVDIDRSIGMFKRLTEQLNLNSDVIKNAHLHAVRILTLLMLSYNDMSYVQGYDRYVLVVYALTLLFTSTHGLPSEFAEALTFQLAQEFIRLSNLTGLLKDVPDSQNYFQKMDQCIKVMYPKLTKSLEGSELGSIHYALRWELLMFADEYSASKLFLLWDEIILNKANYNEFIFYLCISHAMQIPLGYPGEILMEKIQTYKNWDVIKAIDTTHSLMKKQNKNNFSKAKAYICLGAACGLAFCSYFLAH